MLLSICALYISFVLFAALVMGRSVHVKDPASASKVRFPIWRLSKTVSPEPAILPENVEVAVVEVA